MAKGGFSKDKANAKISGETALAIYRSFHFDGQSIAVLVDRFGLPSSTVRGICSRYHWRDVTLDSARELIALGRHPTSLKQ